MKRFARPLGITIGLIATVISLVYIAASWHGQDLTAYASPQAAAGLVICTIFYLAGVAASAAGWRSLLAGTGLEKRWSELAGIISVTQIGKYLPGNVGQHIGRAGLALRHGIGPSPLAFTVVTEALLLLVASVLVGIAALFLSTTSLSAHYPKALATLSIGALVVAAIFGLLAFIRFGPPLLRRFAPSHAKLLDDVRIPNPRTVAIALGWYCAVYLIFGLGIVLMAKLLTPELPQDGWLLVAAFTLAWIIGFVTPGAPAGIGVREGVMLMLLTNAYPPASASIVVIALRLATTMGDGLLLPLGWWLLQRPRNADISRGAE